MRCHAANGSGYPLGKRIGLVIQSVYAGVKIPLQMLAAYVVVDTVICSFERRPDALYAVRMGFAVHVLVLLMRNDCVVVRL